MRSLLPGLLVLAAAMNVAHGDLLRPCTCARTSKVAALSGLATAPTQRACCRRAAEARLRSARALDGRQTGSGRERPFHICAAPRPPREVPRAPTHLDEPECRVAGAGPQQAVIALPRAEVDVRIDARGPPPPARPWRDTPEGLGVHLI